jgi:methyl-accepting chemotaxis protein
MEEKVDKYFTIQNILKITSLVTYIYLTIYSDYYKFVSNYDEFYIKLLLSCAALITIINLFKQDLFSNKKFALAYNAIVGAIFASLSYKVVLLESYKVDQVSLGPWIKLRRLWTPKEYVDMFFDLIKDNPKIDATKISAEFIDQVSKSRSIGDLERYKQILIEQQAKLEVSQFNDTVVMYLIIAVATVAALYFGYQIVNLAFNQQDTAVNKDIAEKLANTDREFIRLRDETMKATQDLNDKIANLAASLEETRVSGQELRIAVKALKNLTEDATAQMYPLLSCSNAVNVIVRAFALDGLESGDPELINEAQDLLKTYFTVSLKMVHEYLGKAGLIADSK